MYIICSSQLSSILTWVLSQYPVGYFWYGVCLFRDIFLTLNLSFRYASRYMQLDIQLSLLLLLVSTQWQFYVHNGISSEPQGILFGTAS